MSGLYGSEVQLKSGETVVTDEAFLRESILEPQATLVQGYPPVMPDRYGDMPKNELEALVAYIKFLGQEGGGS
jgi:cytochrome c oxidase subunit 2